MRPVLPLMLVLLTSVTPFEASAQSAPKTYYRLGVQGAGNGSANPTGPTDPTNPTGPTEPSEPTDPTPQALRITPSPDMPSSVDQGSPVSATYVFSGGKAPYTSTVSGLPAGVTSSNGASSVVLSGTPTRVGGNTPATITVTDSSTPPQTQSFTTQAFNVNQVVPKTLSVYAQPNFYSAYRVNNRVSATFVATNGTPPYTFSAPNIPGISLSVTSQPGSQYQMATLTLSGTTSSTGTIPAATGTVTDSSNPPLTGTYSTAGFDILSSASAPLALAAGQDIPSQLAYGQKVRPFYTVTGGTPPYTVQSISPLDPGFTQPVLSAQYNPQSIEVDGQPTTIGQNPGMVLTVSDSKGATTSITTSPFTVLPPPPITFTGQPAFPTTPTILGDYFGAGYVTTGGAPPYTATFGTADQGLTISPQDSYGYDANGNYAINGVNFQIYGNPTQVGTNPGMTLTVTDATGQTRSFTTPTFTVKQLGDANHLAVNANPDFPTTVSYGTSVEADYKVYGGKPPYFATFSSLPAGLTAGPVPTSDGTPANTFSVTGSPTSLGVNGPATMTVTDVGGHSVTFTTKGFSLVDDGQSQPINIYGYTIVGSDFLSDYYPEPTETVGTSVTGNYQWQGGGIGTVTLSLSGSYPGIVAYSAGPGYLTVGGAPSVPGEVTGLSVVATDAVGNSVSQDIPPFFVTGTNPLAFSRTGDLADMGLGDTTSIPFAVTGANPPSWAGVSFTLLNGPLGLAFLPKDAADPSATLGGTAGETGTFSPTVIASDYDHTVVYKMKSFNVYPRAGSNGGLCVISPFAYGPPPDAQSGRGVDNYVWAQVGCGTAPYVAVTDNAGVIAGQSNCDSGIHCQILYPGVIAGSGSGKNVSVTVYDSSGKSVTLPPYNFVNAPCVKNQASPVDQHVWDSCQQD